MSTAVTPQLQQEIEQFLYAEAALLDDGKFHEWLAILAEDVHYWMPTRYNRTRRERDKDTSGPGEIAFFDEDLASLKARVKRLDTGMAWAEDPPSRTRHLIANVQIAPRSEAGEYDVTSAFFCYRTRLETDENLFVGRREDVLRKTRDGWRVARRRIVLDQNVVLAKNISVFF
ncbi:MAG: 3-phenylpropionate/cinnamic acid dioxygenase subunit beta [Deltaproteobacteria bacterium]|nr:3-phenylpropionate/cinnamic acid dioxygenase subunit beta [Deltaproteobacteria bacterium]